MVKAKAMQKIMRIVEKAKRKFLCFVSHTY